MARYIDADALLEELRSLQVTITGIRVGKSYLSTIVKEYQKSVLKIVHEQPTADVVPRSEVDNWYQLYHSIKEELKQEKMYHRETENLCDRYCIESQQAKEQLAREIIKDLEELVAPYETEIKRGEVTIENLHCYPSYVCYVLPKHEVDSLIAKYKRKYMEDPNG